MKWNWRLLWSWSWPWHRRPSPETLEAQRKYEQVVQDDQRVDNLEDRTNRILEENNLARTVIRALGARGV